MCISTKLLIKGFEPALRFKNERLRRDVGHAAKLLHSAAKRQASNVLLLPSEIVPVIGRKIPQRADCNELKGAAQIGQGRAIIAMQRVERARLETIDGVQHPGEEFILLVANRFNEVTP